MATADNLKEAFAGESQANRKYLAFAKKAEADGYPQIAKLFRGAADAETVHAHAHFDVMGGVKGTAKNLEEAIAGEGFEFQNMYPKFVAQAKAEGNSPAAMSFKNALAVEEIHHELYKQALESFKRAEDLPSGGSSSARSAEIPCGAGPRTSARSATLPRAGSRKSSRAVASSARSTAATPSMRAPIRAPRGPDTATRAERRSFPASAAGFSREPGSTSSSRRCSTRMRGAC
jgi:rubrerythrin